MGKASNLAPEATSDLVPPPLPPRSSSDIAPPPLPPRPHAEEQIEEIIRAPFQSVLAAGAPAPATPEESFQRLLHNYWRNMSTIRPRNAAVAAAVATLPMVLLTWNMIYFLDASLSAAFFSKCDETRLLKDCGQTLEKFQLALSNSAYPLLTDFVIWSGAFVSSFVGTGGLRNVSHKLRGRILLSSLALIGIPLITQIVLDAWSTGQIKSLDALAPDLFPGNETFIAPETALLALPPEQSGLIKTAANINASAMGLEFFGFLLNVLIFLIAFLKLVDMIPVLCAKPAAQEGNHPSLATRAWRSVCETSQSVVTQCRGGYVKVSQDEDVESNDQRVVERPSR